MKKFTEFLLINLGLILVALGIYLFKIPNKFATGGVSGISIIIEKFFPQAPVGLLMLFVNIVLMFFGIIFIGFNFGSKTVYSSFALSGMVWFLEKLHPVTGPITGDAFLELIFAMLLPAIGSAIVFDRNASTGGTDIVAKILSKYAHINVGKALLAADFTIAVAALAVFGPRIGMYSILGLAMKGFLIDFVIEGIHVGKQMVIISDKHEEIARYIVDELKRGATIHKAVGAFTNEEKLVITTVVNRKQAVKLRGFIKELDKTAFVTISNTSEIIGKGFRNLGL